MSPLPPLPDVPLVSVCTTAYNHERYVAEAIESVLAQDWPADRLEYVVIDDGSTDGTLAAIEPYRDRVRVIHQENRGVRATTDRVIAELTGDVICSVAGDDSCPPDRIRLLVSALQRNPNAGLAYSDLEIIDATGRVLQTSFMDHYGLTGHSGRIRGELLNRNFVSGGGIMLRSCLRDVFHPLPDHASWEDYWWAWAVSGVAEVVYVPHSTYRYRVHGANISHGATGERLARSQRVDIRFRRWMLATVQPHEATPAQLMEGAATLLSVTSELLLTAHEPPEVSDAERAQAREEMGRSDRAYDAGDLSAAAWHCARALAADPTSRDAAVMAAALRARLSPPAGGEELRAGVIVAAADELVRRPDLLAEYGGNFGAQDDVTLVVAGPPETIQVLAQILASLDLDGPSSPDLLAITSPTDALRMLRRAMARLGAPCPGALPCFDAGQVAELRGFSERLAGRRTLATT